MLLWFNFIITIISLWIIFYVYNQFIRQVSMDSNRFKLFAMRDELAILAMKGVISASSKEYKTFIELLNESINALGSFNIIVFLKALKRAILDDDVRKKSKTIFESFSKQDDEFKKIFQDYCELMAKIIEDYTWLFRHVFFPITFILLSSLSRVISSVSHAKEQLVSRSNSINDMNNELEDWCKKAKPA